MKYRKKPVVIDAVQLTDKHIENHLFYGDPLPENLVLRSAGYNKERLEIGYYKVGIQTLEGFMEARIGDWIIKGVAGEFYPCKPDIFEATYEVVE